MRHAHLLVAALAGAVSLPALAEEVVCGGPLGADGTEAGLIDAYGKDNVVTGEVDGPEGTTIVATTVFPNDPERSFQVYWWDEEAHEGLASFSLPAGATAPGGLRPGMTAAEVEALNGGPFTITGFGWDYGGFANFGETGALANLPGGCYPSVRFATGNIPDGLNIDSIQGDGVEIPSADPLLAKVDARVESVWLGYAMPEADEEEGEGEEEAGE